MMTVKNADDKIENFNNLPTQQPPLYAKIDIFLLYLLFLFRKKY